MPSIRPSAPGFDRRFGAPSRAQELGWPIIAQAQNPPGHDVLLCAPTGSGKTLAAFMWAINRLVVDAEAGALRDEVSVLYVSPLKALANDIRLNLEEPLDGVRAVAAEMGLELGTHPRRPAHRRYTRERARRDAPPAAAHPRHHARVALHPPDLGALPRKAPRRPLRHRRRTPRRRRQQTRRPSDAHARTARADGARRPARRARRASAFRRPSTRSRRSRLFSPEPKSIARAFATRARPHRPGPRGRASPRLRSCAPIRFPARPRQLDLQMIAPGPELGSLATHQHWEAMYDALASLIREHRTTLVFTLSRRWAERIALALQKRLGEDAVMAHHGSLARAERLAAEQRLKRGDSRRSSPPPRSNSGSTSARSTWYVRSTRRNRSRPRSSASAAPAIASARRPKGRLFALTIDDLLECAAAVRAIRLGHLDEVEVPSGCVDVAAQQIVAIAAEEDEIADSRTSAHPALRPATSPRLDSATLRRLLDRDGDAAAGTHPGRESRKFSTTASADACARAAPRASPRSPPAAPFPKSGNYDVVIASEGRKIGDVEEDFAQESMRGDIFSLGSMPWQILGISKNRCMVEPPPAWRRASRSGRPKPPAARRSGQVCELRRRIAHLLPPRDLYPIVR